MNSKSVIIEVIGVDSPCSGCKKTKENAKKAAAILRNEGYKIKVEKLSITTKETISKYGFLMPPPASAKRAFQSTPTHIRAKFS